MYTAVWWTEYILRRGGVDYLKPRGIYQTWYQRRLLDVWALLLGLLIDCIGNFGLEGFTGCVMLLLRKKPVVQSGETETELKLAR